jgi:predicted metalloprotease with PDZ domain
MIATPAARHLSTALLALVAGIASAQTLPTPIMTLAVDETQAARRLAFVHEEIRVGPGPLSLAYPRWIPGEHGPTGPIEELAALRVHSGGTTLPWVRDLDDINTIHVEVPAGVSTLAVDFDVLLENTISNHQLLVAWNTSILYPRGIDKKSLMIEPSITLPPNWKQGSSLPVTSQNGTRTSFAPVSLERLIDSPILAGEYFRAIPLHAAWPAELDVTGDSQSAIDTVDDAHAVTMFTNLVDQDKAMFGFRHWQTMHFLVSQSDALPFDGLEHEDSPWDAIGDGGLAKKEELEKFGWGLLAHEQSHSWDGKYRRPRELYSKPDYQGPERASLLWVYEGLNSYIGELLSTRAGFNDQSYMRELLARSAAQLAQNAGRATTPLVDTATQNWVIRNVDDGWSSLRRSQDYYDEGALIWLRADMIIREQSHNRRSLDDFLRAFLGQSDTGLIVVPYTREDVEAALSAICPYDWHTFFSATVYQVNNKPPVEGLEAAGWRLVYNATPNDSPTYGSRPPTLHAAYSLGLDVTTTGELRDVYPGTPAYAANLGPHMTILAVDGHAFSFDAMNEAIAHPRDGKIILLIRNFDSVETREVPYTGGLKNPHLERIPGTHDYLTEILAPRTDKKQ